MPPVPTGDSDWSEEVEEEGILPPLLSFFTLPVHERGLLLSFLSPVEVALMTGVHSTLASKIEEWCAKVGLADAIACQEAKLQVIQSHPKVGASVNFEAYRGFLHALQCTSLDNPVVDCATWLERYFVASKPRPQHVQQRFDWGYHGTGYWCDAFGQGERNDYMRLVGNSPRWWGLCVAGADGQYARWGFEHEQSQPRTGGGGALNLPEVVERERKAYIQTSNSQTQWDITKIYWTRCIAEVKSTKEQNSD